MFNVERKSIILSYLSYLDPLLYGAPNKKKKLLTRQGFSHGTFDVDEQPFSVKSFKNHKVKKVQLYFNFSPNLLYFFYFFYCATEN